MTEIFLVRHGHHALVDQTLVGRGGRTGLSPRGFVEAGNIAAKLMDAGITAAQSSPQRRCWQTAGVIASFLDVPLTIEPALDEIDFGHWSGSSFDALTADPRWRRWNERRSVASAPAGESAQAAQRRILDHIAVVRAGGRGGAVVMVTHAEIIRSVLLWQRNQSLDDWGRVTVPPAAVVALSAQA